MRRPTVESMANSDNVLRGGLTQKHVDVPELLRVLSFDSGIPQLLDGEPVASPGRAYGTPSDDLESSRIDLVTSRHCLVQAAHGPDSIIALDGGATLTARGQGSRSRLSFLCPSERTILSMCVLRRQCRSRPPSLARLILSPARSDAAMGGYRGAGTRDAG